MRRQNSELKEIWDLLDAVKDPEVPVLSLWDLGVLQDVRERSGGLVVSITPTYSGCPALEAMREDIVEVLQVNGYTKVQVETRLLPLCGSPATRLGSEFGSTACKSLYQCSDCQEPFDYFKTI